LKFLDTPISFRRTTYYTSNVFLGTDGYLRRNKRRGQDGSPGEVDCYVNHGASGCRKG